MRAIFAVFGYNNLHLLNYPSFFNLLKVSPAASTSINLSVPKMNIPARCVAVAFLATIVIAATANGMAATQTWTVLSGDWHTPSNWGGTTPTKGLNAAIVNGGTATVTQLGETCRVLSLGSSSSAESGTVQMNAGSLSAIFNELIGNSGPGIFTQSGGTHSADLYLGNLGGGSGTYNLSGGSLSTSSVVIGNSGPGSFTQTGGTHSVSSEMYLGYDTGSSGTYTLSGSGLLSASFESVGGLGIGNFTQSGGTHSASGLVLAESASSAGIYNLNGGLLTLSGLIEGLGSAAFNFSGGTFQAGSTFSTSMPIVLGEAGSNAVFDTGGNNLTLSGGLGGFGSLTKIGGGALILSGTDLYRGGTKVNSGMLAVTSSSALPDNQSLTVGAGGTLIFDPSYSFSPILGTLAPPLAMNSPVNPVPEPNTLVLLMVGLAVGLATWQRNYTLSPRR